MNQIQNIKDEKRAIDILEKAFINSKGMTWMLKRKNKKNLRIFLSSVVTIARIQILLRKSNINYLLMFLSFDELNRTNWQQQKKQASRNHPPLLNFY